MPSSTTLAAGGAVPGGPTSPLGDGSGSGGSLLPGGPAGGDPTSAGGSAPLGSDPGSATAGGAGQPDGAAGASLQTGSQPGAAGAAPGVGVPGGDTPAPGVGDASGAAAGRDAGEALEAGIPGLSGSDPFGRLSRLASLATLLSTTTTIALAFLLFGRKRRDEAPTESDANLAAAAASPYAMLGRELAPAYTGVDPGTGGTDVNLPRWRRPSLLAARKSDPVRNGADHVTLTFSFQDAPASGGERRVIRYQLVRLLDRPDELLGQAIDSLDEGDEVEVIEHKGTYRRVITPDGHEGWIHRMTLGDIVTDTAPSAPRGVPGAEDVVASYIDAGARA